MYSAFPLYIYIKICILVKRVASRCLQISHVLNELETGYEFFKSIELKIGYCHMKERLKISKLTKYESR